MSADSIESEYETEIIVVASPFTSKQRTSGYNLKYLCCVCKERIVKIKITEHHFFV